MKKSISVILFLLFFTNIKIYTQPYQSIFGQDTTEWSVFTQMFTYYDTWKFSICCDTIIEAKVYKRLTSEWSTDCIFSSPNCLYLREDTVNGRLWLYDLWSEKEYLSMDLGLNVGDTFWINPDMTHQEIDTNAIVDSVYYDNGRKVIRLSFNNSVFSSEPRSLKFIEGIGPTFGVFFQAPLGMDFNPPRQLLCASKDDVYVYKDKMQGAQDTCHYTIVSVDELNTLDNFLLYPNPFQDNLSLSFPYQITGNIIIYNSIGDEEIVCEINNAISLNINTSSLKRGLYLARIVVSNQKSKSYKILKY